MKKEIYTPEECTSCKQKTTYLVPVDRGTVEIVRAIGSAIGRKGINVVHPRNELEGKTLTSNQVGNLSRPRMHGLIARIKGNPGNYCLTTKGAQFLRGTTIPKFAVRSITEKRTIGYWGDECVSINSFSSKDDRWEGIGYTIEAGYVVYDLIHNENTK